MKKIIVTVVLAGMLVFTVFQFMSDDSEEKSIDEQADDIENNTAVTPTKDDDDEDVVESDDVGVDMGEIAPDFELTTLDGEKVKLSDFKGEKVLVNFWATWCPPCRAEMPDMEKLHNDKDIKILAVNLTDTESDLDAVKKFVDEVGATFTIPLDDESETAINYDVIAYPTTYMLDENGRIQFKSLGALNYDQMRQEVEKME